MPLNSNDLLQLGSLAIKAARQAGEFIAAHAKDKMTVQTKTGGSSRASQVVTEVDLLCQELILQTLSPTLAQYDLALLTEESTDDHSRFEKDYFWCIDPLDGTLPFIESTPGYAVSIALVARDGTPQIGVVYDPVEQTLYHAVKGQGAFRNEQAWKVQSSGTSFHLIADRSFARQPHYAETLAAIKRMADCPVETILHGGAAMNACWVLEKAPACYFKFPKPDDGGGSLWDYAATACIFREAGAVATDMRGAALDLNRRDSTFMNHRGILYASSHEIADAIMQLRIVP